MERVQELAFFGGFTDFDYLRRTLGKEFQQMESWYSFCSSNLFYADVKYITLCLLILNVKVTFQNCNSKLIT